MPSIENNQFVFKYKINYDWHIRSIFFMSLPLRQASDLELPLSQLILGTHHLLC